jgi:hypothetical protein
VPEVQGEVQAVDEVLLPRWWRRRRKKSMPVFLSPFIIIALTSFEKLS